MTCAARRVKHGTCQERSGFLHEELTKLQSKEVKQAEQAELMTGQIKELMTGNSSMNLELERLGLFFFVCVFFDSYNFFFPHNIKSVLIFCEANRQKQMLPTMNQQLQQLITDCKKMDGQIQAGHGNVESLSSGLLKFLKLPDGVSTCNFSTFTQITVCYTVDILIFDDYRTIS